MRPASNGLLVRTRAPRAGSVGFRMAVLAAGLVAVSGCTNFEDEAQRSYVTSRGVGTTNVTFTTADVRLVMERQRMGSAERVVCTEPSPDVSKALSSVLSLAAKGGNGQVTGDISFGSSTAEAVVELAGRSTALLGLRDGLYRACEAYANGAIGADAYALVLSRYGQIMTTLFLGQDITGAAGTAGHAAIASPIINISAPNSTQQTGGQSTNGSTSGDSSKTGSSTDQGSGSDKDGKKSDSGNTSGSSAGTVTNAGASDMQKKLDGRIGINAPGALQLAQSPTSQSQSDKSTDKSNDTAGTGSDTTVKNTTTASPAKVSDVAALSLTRMNEDYFALDLNPAHLLAVACINAADPTRGAETERMPDGVARNARKIATVTNGKINLGLANPYLNMICSQLDWPTIETAVTGASKLALQIPPVNPVALSVSETKQPATTPKQPQQSAKFDRDVYAAQIELKNDGEDAGSPDGIGGPKTKNALLALQKKYGISPADGTLNDATRKHMGLPAAAKK